MNEREMKLYSRIPKKYRAHIVSVEIVKSGCYNARGQELNNYIVIWDNEESHIFESIEMMLFLLKEYNNNGYYEP